MPCVGLVYIHETLKVIHLDFNSKNILLTNDWRVKICDFGLSMFSAELNDPDIYQRKRVSPTMDRTSIEEFFAKLSLLFREPAE